MVQKAEPMVDRPTDVSKEKAKIDRTSQTLQTLLSEKGDSQALDNWVQKDPQIFERLFDMVMVYKVSTRRIGFKAYNKNNKELITLIRSFPSNIISLIHKVSVQPFYESIEIFNEKDDGIQI